MGKKFTALGALTRAHTHTWSEMDMCNHLKNLDFQFCCKCKKSHFYSFSNPTITSSKLSLIMDALISVAVYTFYKFLRIDNGNTELWAKDGINWFTSVFFSPCSLLLFGICFPRALHTVYCWSCMILRSQKSWHLYLWIPLSLLFYF